MIVRELELDRDAFEGPFDLLMTLVLKDELDLRELDVAGIVLAFLERLAERESLDLEACGEFLVLISALLTYQTLSPAPDNDVAWAANIETFAADAWFHKKLPADLQQQPLKQVVDPARYFFRTLPRFETPNHLASVAE